MTGAWTAKDRQHAARADAPLMTTNNKGGFIMIHNIIKKYNNIDAETKDLIYGSLLCVAALAMSFTSLWIAAIIK